MPAPLIIIALGAAGGLTLGGYQFGRQTGASAGTLGLALVGAMGAYAAYNVLGKG
ncbi:MAG: hypothetical protein MK098_12940 [Marinovum sp.]|nr:hypothetical protein [Marinovum sp.]